MNLPAALPGETLFSRYIRHQSLLGLSSQEYVCWLFGKYKISVHPYLTIGTQIISQITLESEYDIFKHQTLGRYYAYFLPCYEQKIRDGLKLNDGSLSIRASQIVSVRETEKLTIKFCPLCATEDSRSYGVSYWHLAHQLPGVEACSRHKVFLVHKDLPTRPNLRPNFFPPLDNDPKICSTEPHEFSRHAESYLNFITSNESCFNLQELIQKLKKHGYITDGNSVRRKKLTRDLFNCGSDLERTAKTLLPKSPSDHKYCSYLLSGKSTQHPFKYLLISYCLSKQPFSSYTNKLASNRLRKTDTRDLEQSCIALLMKGESLSEVTRITGKSQSYLKLLSARNGINVHGAPVKITPEVKALAIRLAMK